MAVVHLSSHAARRQRRRGGTGGFEMKCAGEMEPFSLLGVHSTPTPACQPRRGEIKCAHFADFCK